VEARDRGAESAPAARCRRSPQLRSADVEEQAIAPAMALANAFHRAMCHS
jgi:hypothetical protein